MDWAGLWFHSLVGQDWPLGAARSRHDTWHLLWWPSRILCACGHALQGCRVNSPWEGSEKAPRMGLGFPAKLSMRENLGRSVMCLAPGRTVKRRNTMARLAEEKPPCAAVSVSFWSIRAPFPLHLLCPHRGQMPPRGGCTGHKNFSLLFFLPRPPRPAICKKGWLKPF